MHSPKKLRRRHKDADILSSKYSRMIVQSKLDLETKKDFLLALWSEEEQVVVQHEARCASSTEIQIPAYSFQQIVVLLAYVTYEIVMFVCLFSFMTELVSTFAPGKLSELFEAGLLAVAAKCFSVALFFLSIDFTTRLLLEYRALLKEHGIRLPSSMPFLPLIRLASMPSLFTLRIYPTFNIWLNGSRRKR